MDNEDCVHEELRQSLFDLVEEYREQMNPAVFIALLMNFTVEIAFKCAPDKKEAIKILKDMLKQSIKYNPENDDG